MRKAVAFEGGELRSAGVEARTSSGRPESLCVAVLRQRRPRGRWGRGRIRNVE